MKIVKKCNGLKVCAFPENVETRNDDIGIHYVVPVKYYLNGILVIDTKCQMDEHDFKKLL